MYKYKYENINRFCAQDTQLLVSQDIVIVEKVKDVPIVAEIYNVTSVQEVQRMLVT